MTITLRGFILLVFSIWLIMLPGRGAADVVAQTLGGAIIVFVFLLLFSVIATYRRVKRTKYSLSVLPRTLQAQSGASLCVTVDKVAILPLTKVILSPDTSAGLDLPSIEQPAGSYNKSEISMPIVFPHRGYWQFDCLTLEAVDICSLFKLRRKQISESQFFRVAPAESTSREDPKLIGTPEAGSLFPDTTIKSDEFFDFKQYDKADGARRILWKTFARTGVLLSRAPELASIPEGQLILYTFADKSEDNVARATVDLLARLSNNGISFLFSCEGYDADPVVSVSEAEEILIRSVWDTGGVVNFDMALEQLCKQIPTLTQGGLIFIISAARYKKSQSDYSGQIMLV